MSIEVVRENKRTPRELQARITQVGGRNPHGAPMFRLVWGWSRLAWIGGEWEDHDDAGTLIRKVTEFREVPKYTPFDRWHVEKWVPPETYGTPEQWKANLEAALGPYPSRGEWEHCFTIQTRDGGFVNPCDSDIADEVVRMVEASRCLNRATKRQALEQQVAKGEKEWDAEADAILDDVPAGRPRIVVPDLSQTLALKQGESACRAMTPRQW